MNTTHTQGNWHTNEGQIYPQETGKTLALIPYFDKENEEMEANSKLIASAPDLLKALQDLLEDVQYSIKDIPFGAIGQRQINAAKEAINKATL
jgi:hypothetical protein